MTSRVLVALRIAAPAARVFEAFTAETDRWWKPNPLFDLNGRPDGRLSIEAGGGGKVWERYPDGTRFEAGEVRVWEPPALVEFTWRPASFAAAQVTSVRVVFEDLGAETRVVLEHLGWDEIPERHATRHGFPLSAFQRRLAEWWQDQLGGLGAEVVRAG